MAKAFKWDVSSTLMLENGIVFHSHVIGLPYFVAPLEGDVETETVEPKPPVSVN